MTVTIVGILFIVIKAKARNSFSLSLGCSDDEVEEVSAATSALGDDMIQINR